jgi:hypothetical protein
MRICLAASTYTTNDYMGIMIIIRKRKKERKRNCSKNLDRANYASDDVLGDVSVDTPQ